MDYNNPSLVFIIGLLFVFLGIFFSPAFVANHMSPDGVLTAATLKTLLNLRLAIVFLGILLIIFRNFLCKCSITLSKAVELMSSRTAVFILFGLSFACVFDRISYGLSVYDEGLFVYSAARILGGDVPYRDFWTLSCPGQLYLFALLFKIFGYSIMVERVFGGIIHSLIIVCTYVLAKRVSPSNSIPIISLVLITMWVSGVFASYATPLSSALLLTLLSCICLIRYFSKRNMWNLIIAGNLVGLTAVFRQDIWIYNLLAGTVVVVAFEYTCLSTTDAKWEEKLEKILKIWRKYLLSAMLIILPLALFFVYIAPIQETISQLIMFYIKISPQYRSLPYPVPVPNPMRIINGELTVFKYISIAFERIPFYFPLIVFAIMTVLIIVWVCNKRDKQTLSEKEWGVILLILLGTMFFKFASVRSDVPHLTPMIIPAIILLSPLLSTLFQVVNNSQLFGIKIELHRGHRILFVFFEIFVISILAAFVLSLLSYSKSHSPDFLISPSDAGLTPLRIDRARGIYGDSWWVENLQKTVKFIQKNVPEGERIFVGNPRHDKIFSNDAMFYFLAERHSATRYHDLEPGVATTRSVQKEIINDLERYKVTYIVLWNGTEYVTEPNKGSISSGVTDLDDFIRSNYKAVENFGNYTIYSRVNQTIAELKT